MPELPEVETIVRTLRPLVGGIPIANVRIMRSDVIDPPGFDLAPAILGRTISALSRRGKKIVFQLDDGNRFYIHLGMSGRLTMDPPDALQRPHTHLIFTVGRREMRFVDPRRFGGLFWLGSLRYPDDGLGPEPFSIKPSYLVKRLAKTRRAIKTALLDQKLIAGLGNIYADEALFAAGINPTTLANRLSPSQISRLNRSIKTVLYRAIRYRGSTLRDYRDGSGEPGNFQKVHRVYARDGKPCLACRQPISRIVLGGRSTHFCPNCQPKKSK